MPGMRLYHPAARNARFTMTDPAIPYGDRGRQCTPPEFGGCGQWHSHKTHHLNIDDTGHTIIEVVLFEKVKANLFAYGFEIDHVVANPPPLGIGLGPMEPGRGAWGNIPIVRAEGSGG